MSDQNNHGEGLPTFRKDLESLINRYSLENSSSTPDFILAEYLCGCLNAFDKATQVREQWYGRWPKRVDHRNDVNDFVALGQQMPGVTE